MWGKEQQEVWSEIKSMWNESSHSKEIKIDMSKLVTELEQYTSQFERDLIQKDINFIKRNVSQFEKDSIKSDIAIITKAVKKFIAILKRRKN
ncbi:hypothetical protein [Pseudotenacibaculum haliotis]|uniref:Uncharacterized protein n=1 Tax=Pseudotenacibaculum haliotis TaxID=1862138 RepID=A0ABW5LV08_9FLAO